MSLIDARYLSGGCEETINVCDEQVDTNSSSMALTAVRSLLHRYGVRLSEIGHLQVDVRVEQRPPDVLHRLVHHRLSDALGPAQRPQRPVDARIKGGELCGR